MHQLFEDGSIPNVPVFVDSPLAVNATEIFRLHPECFNKEIYDFLFEKSGSYESLFNKRAMKYRALGLNTAKLTEGDFRKYILKEYTFIKRPILVIDGLAFVENSKKNEQVKKNNLIEINTVDKFQGAERDIIIYDNLVPEDEEAAKETNQYFAYVPDGTYLGL